MVSSTVKLKVVTGYIPLPKHPRTAEEYGKLGEEMFSQLNVPIHPFYEDIEDCWLTRYLRKHQIHPNISVGDNPEKNTLSYHIVQHQKFEWLCKAALYDPRPDVLVWMDYGIGHVPGVTPTVVREFLDKVVKWDLAIPGCWKEGDPRIETVGDDSPNWRFCGGLMVVPRNQLIPLYKRVRQAVGIKLSLKHHVTWEVNTLADIEQFLPIRWYEADHDASMFTEYASEAGKVVRPSGLILP
jgi:hypothetical protein